MIGRRAEQGELTHWLHSGRPEFIVVYGRRRIGKTFLVNEFFRHRFAFRATGVSRGSMREQLVAFNGHLVEHGASAARAPESWFEAFSRLKELLSGETVAREPASGRIVVFLDEVPWMDTPRSGFKPAFEHFWNSWASQRDDIMLIACGSAASWLVANLLNDAEGLYRRVTGKLNLQPFTLGECESLLLYNNVEYSRPQVIELYEAFGGVPYYLNLVRGELSPAQNIQRLCFAPGCQLEGEFGMLFRSLFKHPDDYMAVVRALARRKGGLSNSEMRKAQGLPDGASLGRVLENLELCGLIRKTGEFGAKSRGARYQLVDFFSLFHLDFIERKPFDSWETHVGTPSYAAWRGNRFELVCAMHVDEVKSALGIAGIEARTCAWRSRESEPGVQIDLLIDRRDRVVSICEAKFTNGAFAFDKTSSENLTRKREVFRNETGTSKSLQTVLISVSGLARNKYFHTVQSVVGADALFS